MRYSWEIKTAPTLEPVTIAEMKQHLRIGHSEDDTQLKTLIESARLQLERETGLAFVTQTRTLRFSCFPSNLEYKLFLPGEPVASITHVKYYDGDGVQQTWNSSNYTLRQGRPSWVGLNYDVDWPDHRGEQDEIEIEYICGAAVGSVDQRVKHAIKLKVQLDYAEQHNKEWERVNRSYESLKMGLMIGEEFIQYGS